MIDHDWLIHHLGLSPTETPYQAFRVADALHQGVGVLYLSTVEERGYPILSPAARALLDRQRHRLHVLDKYARLACEVAPSSQIVKGATIRSLYKNPLCRSQTDVDLAFADPIDLWRAAARIRATDDFSDPDLTLMEGDPSQAYIAFERPAPDIFFEKPVLVELSATPFYGDGRHVSVRAAVPANPLETSLLAICEERFQRAFHLRDLIDAALLLEALELTAPGWATNQSDLLERYALAPELQELWGLAADTGLASVPPIWLDAARRAEDSKRNQGRSPSRAPNLHGLLVDDAPQGGETPFLLERSGEKPLLLTTVGTFLLTSTPEVSTDEVSRARAAVAQSQVIYVG
ncbi:hypothetical protein [Arthrobacter zhaoguopingii]|uniref:hypothetical protein n=1 Tax=Arthrobacter zhaoguopingii TaxID=2681491 RepID=UPI0013599486|nr:hypothetical protein [Arthrobacter zhaoguopingii]